MPALLPGFSLIALAAICGGAFAVPLQHRRKFELENLYVLASLATMVILPWLAAMAFLPHWTAALASAGSAVTLMGMLYGFAWGVGSVTFGYGITMAGLSLGYALIMGVNTAVGSILPFLMKSPGDLLTPGGKVILLGILGCVAGVAVCGRAGAQRERSAAAAPGERRSSALFVSALVVCVASGVLSACANLGFAFTARIALEARTLGAAPAVSTLASWLPVYWGGFAANLLWFGGRQIARGTWRNNLAPGSSRDWILAAVMGTLWFLAMILYGMGAHYLGRLGTSVGWAINIASSLIVANLFGFVGGEWRGAPVASVRTLFAGLSVLVAAMAVLGLGNSMITAGG